MAHGAVQSQTAPRNHKSVIDLRAASPATGAARHDDGAAATSGPRAARNGLRRHAWKASDHDRSPSRCFENQFNYFGPKQLGQKR